MADEYRCATIGRTVEAVMWVTQRRCGFRTNQLATELGTGYRTALRYLKALEASGIVTCNKANQPWTWRNSGALTCQTQSAKH